MIGLILTKLIDKITTVILVDVGFMVLNIDTLEIRLIDMYLIGQISFTSTTRVNMILTFTGEISKLK